MYLSLLLCGKNKSMNKRKIRDCLRLAKTLLFAVFYVPQRLVFYSYKGERSLIISDLLQYQNKLISSCYLYSVAVSTAYK